MDRQPCAAGQLSVRWLPPAGLLALVAGLLALALRVMSAGGYGANIGGGFMILFGLPAAIAVSTIAVIQLIRAARAVPGSSAANR